jgi:pyrroline-5-carboxylate reductase
LAAAADESPRQLAERVASPGGMTREGLNVLDRSDGLSPLIRQTLEAAVRRSREMGQAARTR